MPRKNSDGVQLAVWLRQAIEQRNTIAFEKIVKMHQSQVRAFVRRLTYPDTGLADDIAQETFLKAYTHLASFKGQGRFIGWLFKIAYQQFAQYYRRNHQWRSATIEPDVDTIAKDNTENQLSVEQLLQFLTLEQKTAITLHYYCGLTHPEIAMSMDIPLGTVKTHIHNGKATMQSVIEEDMDNETK